MEKTELDTVFSNFCGLAVELAFEKNQPEILRLLVDNTSNQRDYTVKLPSISDDHLKYAKILLNSAFKIKNINRIINKGFDNLEWLKEIMKHHNLYSAKNFK